MSDNGPSRKGEGGVQVRVLSVPDSGYLTVLFCGRIHGYRVHPGKKKKVKPRLCFGRDCPLCRPYEPQPRWYGYVAAEVTSGATDEWTSVVLEITQQCYHCLAGIELPGTLWFVWRTMNEFDKKEVTAERAEHQGTDRYNRHIGVQNVLRRLYFVDELPPEVAPPEKLYQEIERSRHNGLPTRRMADRPSGANVEPQKLPLPAGKTMRQLLDEATRANAERRDQS